MYIHKLKIGVLAVAAIFLTTGNTGCEQKDTLEGRQLKRRVQMGSIKAPPIPLPQGGQFDFQYVANAQIYHILNKTQAFSTATIDPNMDFTTEGLSRSEEQAFRQCQDPEDQINPATGVMQKSTISQVAGCMIDLPQGIVSGNILDFTLISDAGLSIQLNNFALAGASFQTKKYELSMTMKVMHPLLRGGNQRGDRAVLATTSKQSFGRDGRFSLGINLGMFNLGPSYYFQSPLRQVVDDGLTLAVRDLRDQWLKAEPWSAMVLRNCDKYIYINAGNQSDAGLKKGDILRVQNMDYRWSGPICQSQLLGMTDFHDGPVSYAVVTSVGTTMATAKIIENDSQYPQSRDQTLKPGARVYLEKMVD